LASGNPDLTHQVDITKLPTRPGTKIAGPPDVKPGESTSGGQPDVPNLNKTVKTAAEAVDVYRASLRTLREDIEGIDDPLIKAAMERYMNAANQALIHTTRRGAHARPAPHQGRAARSRR
jgi:hypothetical protein